MHFFNKQVGSLQNSQIIKRTIPTELSSVGTAKLFNKPSLYSNPIRRTSNGYP